MNVKKIREEKGRVTLLVTGTHPQFVNALRRLAMSSVPTLAIENISIYRNDSVLFDEYIASRLGQLPLKTGKSFKKGERAKLVLHEKGPKMVVSGDISSKSGGAEVVNKEIPIVTLGEGQEVKMEMEAVMESGSEHVKWQPAIISYNELPEINGKAGKVKNAQKIADNCPMKVLEVRAGKLVLKDPYNCTLCGYCEDLSGGTVELAASPSSFVINIESHGQKSVKDLLDGAAEILKDKASEFQSEASKKLKK